MASVTINRTLGMLYSYNFITDASNEMDKGVVEPSNSQRTKINDHY